MLSVIKTWIVNTLNLYNYIFSYTMSPTYVF